MSRIKIYQKCTITYNGSESLDLLLNTEKSTFSDVENVIEAFKRTELYKSNDWDDGSVIGWIRVSRIDFIPLNMETVYEFQLPEPNED